MQIVKKHNDDTYCEFMNHLADFLRCQRCPYISLFAFRAFVYSIFTFHVEVLCHQSDGERKTFRACVPNVEEKM